MIVLRRLTDIAELMKWRTEVIAAVFGQKPDPALSGANRRFYMRHAGDGSHFAIVASVDGHDAGCGAVCFYDELPSPDNPSGRCAYLMNVYVKPLRRRQGLARIIVRCLVDEALRRGCGKIYLETTSNARRLYLSGGFANMPDMMKYNGCQ